MGNIIGILRISRSNLVNSTILIVLEAYFELLIGSLLAINMFTAIEVDERTGSD